MNITENILAFLRGKNNTNSEAPVGLCPNCWGREEYGGRFYTAIKNNDLDINSKNPKVGWIKEYVDKNLTGIQLTNNNNIDVCQKCKLTYRPNKMINDLN